MIFLRDFKSSFNKKYIALGLFFGILGILSPFVSKKYGVILSVVFFILSFLSTLFANRFKKSFEGRFEDKISLKDSFDAVARDKYGNLKAKRHGSS